MSSLKTLIVGGASGLVQPTLVEFARSGRTLAITGRDGKKLAAVVEQIAAAAPGSCPVLPIVVEDPSDDRQIENCVQTLRTAWDGEISAMLVAVGATGGDSAKVLPGQDIATIDIDGWVRSAELNCYTPLRWLRTVGAWFMEQPTPGAIGLIGSISSDEMLSIVGGYGSAKAALSTGYATIAYEMTAQRLAANLPQITVNEIAPGFFPTEQNATLLTGARRASILSRTPFGRFGTPEELVPAFTMVATPGGFMHLERVVVDGGFSKFSGVLPNRP